MLKDRERPISDGELESLQAGEAARVRDPAKRMSPDARHHRDESRRVLAAHPELRALNGANRMTALAVPVLLVLHWGLAWLVSGGGILPVFLAAFFVGQVILHAAGALLHETAHQLIFRKGRAKLAFDLGLELILASFGKQLRYQHEHISSHHPYQGEYEWDYEHEDICAYLARRELKAHHPGHQRILTAATLAVHLLPFGFLIADMMFPPVYAWLTGREVKDRRRNIGATQPARTEVWLFVGVSLLANAILFFGFGFWAWLYHNWSLSLFLSKWGVTNLGQSLSEHPDDDKDRPTRSTYGWVNVILFNTGYHHEHHTFPNVPWTRLPRIKAAAPEVFNCASERSYFRLWWDHIRADFSPSRWNPHLQAERLERCEKEPQV